MAPGPLFVGVDPGYARRVDVEIQTKLVRPDVVVVSSLRELAGQLTAFLTTRAPEEVVSCEP